MQRDKERERPRETERQIGTKRVERLYKNIKEGESEVIRRMKRENSEKQ